MRVVIIGQICIIQIGAFTPGKYMTDDCPQPSVTLCIGALMSSTKTETISVTFIFPL